MRNFITLPAVLLGLAAVYAGCGGETLTAQSTCRDYVAADRAAQQKAVQQVAQDNHAAYSVLVQNNVDARCSVRPDNTILWAITGEGDDASASAPTADSSQADEPAEPDATEPPDEPDSDAPEVDNQPRADVRIPTEAEQRALQQQEPCVGSMCGDELFINCSDMIDPELWKQCAKLGIPWKCACYHGSMGDQPGYWARQEN